MAADTPNRESLLRQGASPRCQQTVFDFVGGDMVKRPCALVAEHWGRCAMAGQTPDAGDYDDEDAYNCDTDKYDRRAIQVKCPGCGRMGSPLCSCKTEMKDHGMRWVGCDHREPFARYSTTCRCGQAYMFTTYTPQ